MPFPYTAESTQAAVLSATSNVIAQAIKAYQNDAPFSLNPTPILQFSAYALINTPLNCAWQEWLEANYPGTKRAPPTSGAAKEKPTATTQDKGSIDMTNTAIKFLLDQTIGAAFNTILFVIGIGLLQGKSWDDCVASVRRDGMDIYWAGAKLWPAVSLLSFTLVPVNRRVLFGCVVGVFWGIILSLKVGEGK